MARAFPTLEILETILNYSDKPTLYACARTCKTWKPVALKILWSTNAMDFTSLLALLGVTTLGDGNQENITYDEWENFFSEKAPWIHSFEYKDLGSRSIPCADISCLLASRTRLSLLPNLTSLVWSTTSFSSLDLILPFLSSASLHSVVLSLKTAICRQTSLNLYYAEILKRTQTIKHLSLTFATINNINTEQLRSCLEALSCLEEVALQPCLQNNVSLMQTLSVLPNLKRLRTTKKRCYCDEPVVQEDVTLTAAQFLGFSYLESAEVGACLMNPLIFLKNATSFQAMEKLVIDIQLPHLQAGVSAIASTCVNLSILGILAPWAPECSTGNPEYVGLTFGALRPLLQCKHIQHFDFFHDCGVTINANDAIDIGQSWPQLIHLGVAPNASRGCGTSFSAIAALLQHCPQLERLGMFIEFGELDVDLCRPRPCHSLSELTCGGSFPEDAASLLGTALFLKLLCPCVHVRSWDGLSLYPDVNDGQPVEPAQYRLIAWKGVQSIVPQLERYKDLVEEELIVSQTLQVFSHCHSPDRAHQGETIKRPKVEIFED